MAVASMNHIKSRMKSVQSTMQITKAMELVATSKLRRAKEKAEGVRPFLDTLDKAIDTVSRSETARETAYFREVPDGKVLYLVIAGDRGLAGGYNANVFRAEKAKSKGTDALFLPIGKKAADHYRRAGSPLYGEPVEYVSLFGVGDAMGLSAQIVADYLAGKFTRVVLIYTHFASMLSQVPTVRQILPIRPSEGKPTYALFEGNLQDILREVVLSYVAGCISAATADALAAESGARRTAMNAANKNAGEMIDSLQLHYNRARQAVITQEITEIVSGAEAL